MSRLTLACALLLGSFAIGLLPHNSFAQDTSTEAAAPQAEAPASAAAAESAESKPDNSLPAELTEPGIDSPHRNRSVEENLAPSLRTLNC